MQRPDKDCFSLMHPVMFGDSGRRGLLGLTILGLCAAASAGCGGNGQTVGTGTGGTSPVVITGTGGNAGSSTSSSTGKGGGGATSSSSTGMGDPKLGPPYPIVLCHGFFGFDEFAGVQQLPYFYDVPERLAEDGEKEVFTPAVDPFNSSDFRAAQLATHIQDILDTTGREKVILIGHSQGGLDARAVASEHPELVAAVVTVATPHHGSPVADIALGLVDDPGAAGLLDALAKLLGGPLYDQVGDETSIAKALYLFTEPGSEEFNQSHPDQAGVYYASITGRTDYSLGGQDCAPDVDLPWVYALHTDKDPVDPFMSLTESMIDGGFGDNDPNDGLVRALDAKWGEFWGCVPADHMDEVGQLVGDSPGLLNGFDHEEMFADIVKELRKKGY
jgi:triacylglycerol lipase